MLEALVHGTTDPDVLAELARGKLRAKLPGCPQGAAVSPAAVLLKAPRPRMGPRLFEVGQHLASEAVLAHAGHGALDAPFVAGPAHAGGIDDEAARLGVLQEGRVEAGLQRIRVLDDRLGVVRDEGAEDPWKNAQAASHASIADAVVS